MKYSLVNNNGARNITVDVNGEWHTADDSHPYFDEIVERAFEEDPSVVELFDISKRVSEKFEHLSERVSVANGEIYFDGEAVDNSLTRTVIRFLNRGENFMPLVNFFEKIMTNPNKHSRDQLYDWLNDRDFTLLANGDFIAYKGVSTDLRSINSGYAVVNGQPHNGRIPNEVGAVVEMPRGSVQADSGIGCSIGLHAGTWEYASRFGRGQTLKVGVNPRDVVSVPTDCSAQKLRTCRYRVLEAVEAPDTSLVDYDPWFDDVEYEHDCV